MSIKNFLRPGNIAQPPFLCTLLCDLPRIIRTLFIKCPFAPQCWNIPVPHGAVEVKMSFQNFLRPGNIAQPPFLCTLLCDLPRIIRTLFIKLPIAPRCWYNTATCLLQFMHLCVTLIHNRYYLLCPWLCAFFVRNPRHHWWSHMTQIVGNNVCSDLQYLHVCFSILYDVNKRCNIDLILHKYRRRCQ